MCTLILPHWKPGNMVESVATRPPSQAQSERRVTTTTSKAAAIPTCRARPRDRHNSKPRARARAYSVVCAERVIACGYRKWAKASLHVLAAKSVLRSKGQCADYHRCHASADCIDLSSRIVVVGNHRDTEQIERHVFREPENRK